MQPYLKYCPDTCWTVCKKRQALRSLVPWFEFAAFQSWNRTATSDELWLCFQQSDIILSSPKHPDRVWVPPSLLLNGFRWLVFRDKTARVRRWAFTSVANLKNAFSYTFTLPRVFMAWWLFESIHFCNKWRTRHSTELMAGFCGKHAFWDWSSTAKPNLN